MFLMLRIVNLLTLVSKILVHEGLKTCKFILHKENILCQVNFLKISKYALVILRTNMATCIGQISLLLQESKNIFLTWR